MELNDEMMAKATGGELDPWNETVVISGIVMVNPRPDDPAYASVWDDCQSSGYQVYEGGGRLLVAGSHLPSLTPGDEVYVTLMPVMVLSSVTVTRSGIWRSMPDTNGQQ